jgi:CRISPR-associated protein Cas5 subtype I-B
MTSEKAISFEIRAPVMSFRKPRYENYQLSYSIPPKTMIAGMIANAYNHGEKFFYELLKDFQYGVVTLNIKGKFKDLWRAIQGKGDESGKKSIFLREKFFYPHYRIYIKSEKYMEDIYESLTNPQNIVYLGLSEELIEIMNVKEMVMESELTDLVDTMIPLNWMDKLLDMEWRKPLENLKAFFPPQVESIIENYKVEFKENNRTKREPQKTLELLVVCGGRFKLKGKTEVYRGLDDDHIILV